MAKFELKLPKMGESVAEATITSWLKEVGDTIEVDDAIVEIATDKVDSDVPSEVAGTLIEKRFEIDQIVKVGEVLAVIQTEGEEVIFETHVLNEIQEDVEATPIVKEVEVAAKAAELVAEDITQLQTQIQPIASTEKRFYSPLVKNIAAKENISQQELDQIKGTGQNNRVTKKDILAYLEQGPNGVSIPASSPPKPATPSLTPSTAVEPLKKIVPPTPITPAPTPQVVTGEDQIIEMSRMGKLIADHMIQSKETSAHVQSFVEVDVTDLWEWREKIKNKFQERTGEKLTFTPLFITAVLKALRDFPILNSSVDGDRIIQKGAINIGMATALADGNLIVPVIKNADHLNLFGLSKAVNDLARRARENKLLPDEVQGGTYTVTNVGNFGSIMGTPIINQPQVGILAVGVIRKMPAVIETPEGDFIGIRRKLILSHSYDHRIINGATGGQFVKNVADYLENWDEPAPI